MRPDLLREKLFSAIARGDEEQFTTLCQQQRALVLESFADWCRVPKESRDDKEAVDAWVRSLILIARYFAAMGYPELLERLTGDADNPITRWNRNFSEASQLADSGQYAASVGLLNEISRTWKAFPGAVWTECAPRSMAFWAQTHFHAGDVTEARRFTALALADCQRIDDREGMRIYTENLSLLSTYKPPVVNRRIMSHAFVDILPRLRTSATMSDTSQVIISFMKS